MLSKVATALPPSSTVDTRSKPSSTTTIYKSRTFDSPSHSLENCSIPETPGSESCEPHCDHGHSRSHSFVTHQSATSGLESPSPFILHRQHSGIMTPIIKGESPAPQDQGAVSNLDPNARVRATQGPSPTAAQWKSQERGRPPKHLYSVIYFLQLGPPSYHYYFCLKNASDTTAIVQTS